MSPGVLTTAYWQNVLMILQIEFEAVKMKERRKQREGKRVGIL